MPFVNGWFAIIEQPIKLEMDGIPLMTECYQFL